MEDWSTLPFLLEYLYETVDIDRKAYREGATGGHRQNARMGSYHRQNRFIISL